MKRALHSVLILMSHIEESKKVLEQTETVSNNPSQVCTSLAEFCKHVWKCLEEFW